MKYFKDKTAEQTFSLCLLISCVVLMLFCAIVRLCGGLWFAADLDGVPVPNEFWQEMIMALLLAFELVFVYKILCRTQWVVCIIISVLEALIGILIGYLTSENRLATNLFYMACILIIPILFVRKWWSIFENALLYGLSTLYGIVFLVGRIGNTDIGTYNFIVNVLSAIDFKIFFVALYLFINYFGGIKIWKWTIFRKDLKTRKTPMAVVVPFGSSATKNPPTKT